ncbi:MAG TPA: glycine/sarcosine/betaine reductase selenoprotein B family protein [Thermomicrobiales bacterium]|nr:glycine/sarcosine/betaine reductase selenoprotein B family protein [Thermomicrobiales bacterium]
MLTQVAPGPDDRASWRRVWLTSSATPDESGGWTDTLGAREDWWNVAAYLDPGERFPRGVEVTPAMETIPWTPLTKPLSECRVALVTTGGVHLKQQKPFDIDNDGYDWSYREVPSDASVADLMVTHNHYDHAHVDGDFNFMLPTDRFRELAQAGVIGELGPRCYSFYGYIKDLEALAETSAKDVARHLKEDGVDAVFMTPA